MNNKSLILLVLLSLCVGCGTQKRITSPKNTWHSLRISNATATLQMDESTMEVQCNIQAVRDSFIALSILPMMGIEMLRVEITPAQITIIDKLSHRYTQTTWKEAASLVVPRLRWADIQTFIEGQPLTQSVRHTLGYTYQGHAISITLINDATTWDSPLQLRPINLSRYEQVSLLTLLNL